MTNASRRCKVYEDISIFAARSMARTFAGEQGFVPEVCEELVVVVSELASNILKYGRRGWIEVSMVETPERGRGLMIVAEDETPPFDLNRALVDGHDVNGKLDPARVYKRGGIAAGLGAVSRLSDSIEQVPHGGGKRIVVRRFERRPRRGSSPAL
jgi:anti-sigma regulatory factor (Ser/Thr protein kinase)